MTDWYLIHSISMESIDLLRENVYTHMSFVFFASYIESQV
jgi:hypothetical protein